MHSLKLALLAFVTNIFAAPTRRDYAVKETHSAPPSWSLSGDAPKDGILNLQIGLKQGAGDDLERHLLEISDPGHYRYGQHLAFDEVVELTQPSREAQELAEAWLHDHNIWQYTWHEPARDWIFANVTIGQAETLLQTKYSTFVHSESSAYVHRTQEWSLPLHLHEHIDVIQPTTSFFGAAPASGPPMDLPVRSVADPMVKREADAGKPDVCKRFHVSPECIRTLYGSIDYEPQVPGQNKIGITNYLNQSSHRNDIRKFLKKWRPEAVAAADDFDIVIINDAQNFQGKYNKSDPDYWVNTVEGTADAELVLGISWPTPLTAYSTGGERMFENALEATEPFLIWQNYMRGQPNIPQVISTSYSDDEYLIPKSYAQRVCRGFAELGARGTSVLFSSGDTGVKGRNGKCNDGNFVARFPASCPWVTAVGGTEDFSERAWFISGGGFSNYFERPQWQDGAVDEYLQRINGKERYEGKYNKSGRGYPDVAAHAESLQIYQGAEGLTVDGTSGSVPIFSSIISLVNDALLAKGKPPLGFLNPWLYSKAYKALTDITDVDYSGTDPCKNSVGFPVKEGWDPATGWGTPNFRRLLEAAGAA